MSDLLEGRVALVTGGGGGIGRGISVLFAANRARVIVAEIDEARAAETVSAIGEAGGDGMAEVVDVRDRAQVEAMGERVGPVDVLVNNVGHYLGGRGAFLESDEAEWEALYRVNLHHVFL
ncbi:MAG: SDR family NAD(P)-dependent oxidoreductase, partial [Acidimicrobiia bacterium]